jgi:hypothetical protein
MFQKTTLIVLLLVLISCKKEVPNEKNDIKIAHWLLGKWENNSDKGKLSEIWEKATDSTFNGQTFFIKAKDTLHFENIQLKLRGEDLFYTSTIRGQNNDKAVTFKLNDTIEKKLVFENLKNNFPQKISYTQITKDSLVIEISGIQQGKPSSEKFSMKKIN